MLNSDLTHLRLHHQRLSHSDFTNPVEVVSWLGAVQSQDYAAGKWALGLRLPGIGDDVIEQAFTDGDILRTHVMRPTWHFVTPADIRWMLELTAPRVHALSATYYRQLELDTALFSRSKAVLVGALEGGNQLTRAELASALEQVGINTNELRTTYLIAHAELDGVICSGARRGKQFTYALLDERVPQAKPLVRDEALAELARRYFVSHGPATLKDYGWWSGLTAADARAGLDMVKSALIEEVINGETYWLTASMPAAKDTESTALLLPNYDEYIVAYTDRSAITSAVVSHKLDSRGNVLFNHTIVIDGQIAGTWRRTFKKSAVVIESTPFRAFSDAENHAFAAAAQRYGEFLAMPVVLQSEFAS